MSVKAASVGGAETFRTGYTLRFPRFKRLRMDRDWSTALSMQEFIDLKTRVEEESKEKEFKLDTSRKTTKRVKTLIVIAGNEKTLKTPYAGPTTHIFEGLSFCIMSEAISPEKKTKAELEQLVRANGGQIFQSPSATPDVICIADKKLVKVASLTKAGKTNIVRPSWLFDCLKQAEVDAGQPRYLLPFEPTHMFFATSAAQRAISESIDEFGDSYSRDVSIDELVRIFGQMPEQFGKSSDADLLIEQLREHGHLGNEVRCWMFRNLKIYLDNGSDSDELRMKLVYNLIRFAGGQIVDTLDDKNITHVVVGNKAGQLRSTLSGRARLPRIVTCQWVEDSWHEKTLLDEERFAPLG